MTTYYVSTSGSNGNAGTSTGAAWATVQYAVNTASSGDTIRILAGSYSRFDVTKPLTIMAHDSGNRPYIQTNYHNIANSATGSALLADAAIYIKASNVTIDGMRIEDERAAAIVMLANGVTHTDITVKNCRLDNIAAVQDFDQSVKPFAARSPVWIQGGSGGSGKIARFQWIDNAIYNSTPRVTEGSGTEIVTFTGDVSDIYVSGSTWDNNEAINLNFLGNAQQSLWQPRNIVVEDCVFTNAYLTRGTAYKTTMCVYFDRGTGPAVIRRCLMYCEDWQTMGFKQNWEPSDAWGTGLKKDSTEIIVHDCVMIANRWAFMVGMKVGAAASVYRPIRGGAYAHNVLISAVGKESGYAIRTLVAYNLRFKNNVIANYSSSSSDGLIQSQTDPRDEDTQDTWEAAGNVLYTARGSTATTVYWGDDSYTAGTFKNGPQGGTGSVGKPVFANGLATINTNTDYSGYDLDDWVLAATSPGYKDAEPLTLANGSGSSETTLIVDDASYFHAGISSLGVGGHDIVVGGTSATVTGVDYENNTLELESAISWSDDDEIYYEPNTAGVYSAGITLATSSDTIPDPPPPPPETKLVNARFDAGTTGWHFSPDVDGSGTFDAEDGVATVTIDELGTTPQVYQYNIDVSSSESLTFAFWGSSGASQTVTAKLILHESPYTSLGLNETFALSPECAKYTKAFTTTGASTNARLQLIIGGSAGALILEDVYLGPAADLEGTCQEGGGGGGGGDETEQSLTVTSGGNDGLINDGAYYDTTDNYISVGENDGPLFTCGWWFETSEAMTTGDMVVTAPLGFYLGGTRAGATAMPTIRFKAILTGAFPASNAAWDALTFTTAYVDWTPDDWTSGDYVQVDIAPVIQELLDAGNIAAGSGIMVQAEQDAALGGGAITQRYIRAYDLGSEYGATLTITTSGAGDTIYRDWQPEWASEWGEGW